MDSAFTFLDPPEPGAQARIAVQLRNRSELPTGPLRLTLSPRWLSGWRVLDADPPVLDDRVLDGTRRVFDYPGLDAEAEGGFELHLVAIDDAVDPPEIGISQVNREPSEGRPEKARSGGPGRRRSRRVRAPARLAPWRSRVSSCVRPSSRPPGSRPAGWSGSYERPPISARGTPS